MLVWILAMVFWVVLVFWVFLEFGFVVFWYSGFRFVLVISVLCC